MYHFCFWFFGACRALLEWKHFSIIFSSTSSFPLLLLCLLPHFGLLTCLSILIPFPSSSSFFAVFLHIYITSGWLIFSLWFQSLPLLVSSPSFHLYQATHTSVFIISPYTSRFSLNFFIFTRSVCTSFSVPNPSSLFIYSPLSSPPCSIFFHFHIRLIRFVDIPLFLPLRSTSCVSVMLLFTFYIFPNCTQATPAREDVHQIHWDKSMQKQFSLYTASKYLPSRDFFISPGYTYGPGRRTAAV